MAKYKYTLNEVVKPKDANPALIQRMEKMFGDVDMENDFFSNDLKTYFKTTSIDQQGSPNHQVIQLAGFSDSLKKISTALKSLVDLKKTKEGADDETIATVEKGVRDMFNKYRTYLRKNYPDQYDQIKSQLEEISTTAAGGDYKTPFAFNPNKKAKGAAVNYYYKLGWKDAPKPKSSKTIDIVDLTKSKTKKLNEVEAQELEGYISSLGVESPNLKKHITDRILGFEKIENKLNTLVPLLGDAKNKTMDYYKQNPDFKIVYPTDLAVDYLDDLIEMFKKEE